MIGMMMSPTSEVTMPPKAAPMMTPTARSTTLPFMAKSRNSFSIGSSSSAHLASSVDQAGMYHGAAHRDAGGLSHGNHRQPQPFLDLAEQRERVFDGRRIAFDEEIGVQRHQLVMQLQRGRHIALLPSDVEFRAQPRGHVRCHRDAAVAAMRH